MIIINDSNMLEAYIKKYSINEIFTKDMTGCMTLFLFKRKEYICRENESIDYLFFFVDGKAKVSTSLSNGKSLLLCFYQGFKVLGDLEFITSQAATTNVQVIEDTYCIGITKDNVKAHLLNDAKFLRFICNTLGEKLNRCSKNSSINLLYPLENRLASYILATGKRDNNKCIELNENLTEISELLGTSYRHLLRTLNNLCNMEVIIKTNSSIKVKDENQLRKLASDLYE